MARVVMYEPGLQRLEAHVVEVRHDVTRAIAKDARRYAPVKTGGMKSTIHPLLLPGDHDRVVVGTDHWQFPEYGTPPHIIRPRTKQALSWPDAAHPVKEVHHPGTPAVAFMRRAVYQKRQLIVVG